MGLFSKKKNKAAEIQSAYTWMTVDEALAYSRGERKMSDETLMKLSAELGEQLGYLRKQQEDTKYEFGQVTQYLADIQRIELLRDRDRADIADTARMILSLDDERIKFQNGDKRLSSSQYRMMELYADELPGRIKEIGRQEEYLNLVREDMHNLEGEKGSIKYNKEQNAAKKSFLTKAAYAVVLLVIVVFIVLIMLMNRTGKDFTVPFFITGVAAMGYVVYYVYAIGSCNTESKKSDYMMNRANVLLNKVKLKYVNTTNAVEYAYEKYRVNSLHELEYAWQTYKLIKEEEKRYRRNTQLMADYEDRLNRLLIRIGIEKPDAWVHQPSVLINRSELMDFKDAVNHRRNKLRAQIDFNNRQQDTTLNEIEALKNKYTGREAVIDATVKSRL